MQSESGARVRVGVSVGVGLGVRRVRVRVRPCVCVSLAMGVGQCARAHACECCGRAAARRCWLAGWSGWPWRSAARTAAAVVASPRQLMKNQKKKTRAGPGGA